MNWKLWNPKCPIPTYSNKYSPIWTKNLLQLTYHKLGPLVTWSLVITFRTFFFSFKTWVGLLILMLRMQRCYLRILFAYLFVRNEQLIRQLQTLTYVATRRTLNAPMDVNRGAKWYFGYFGMLTHFLSILKLNLLRSVLFCVWHLLFSKLSWCLMFISFSQGSFLLLFVAWTKMTIWSMNLGAW